MPKTRKTPKSAVTGRFVTEKFLKQHPTTTFLETIKTKAKKR